MKKDKQIATFLMVMVSSGAAVAMATWIKCYLMYTPCMTMMDGSTGYCEEESCDGVPFDYAE